MTNEQFNRLVRRLERISTRHPRQYRLRVFLLTLAGYSYPFLLLLLFVGGFAASVYGAITLATFDSDVPLTLIVLAAVVCAVGTGCVVKALWVPAPEPPGWDVTRREAPKLFALLDDVRSTVGGPALEAVYLDDSLNAGVMQHPRFWILGWCRNSLLLGLPLLDALTTGEIRGILAHEFGHLSAKHGWFGSWVYRTRESWSRLQSGSTELGALAEVFWGRFRNRFIPYFVAYSSVLERIHEFEADRAGAELEGVREYARALARLHLLSTRASKEFWPVVYRDAVREPVPPKEIEARLGDFLRGGGPELDGARLLERELAMTTRPTDRHPSLRERVEALGVSPADLAGIESPWKEKGAGEPVGSAADDLLGERKHHYETMFSKNWRAVAAKSWRERYNQAQDAMETIRKLEARKQTGSLTEQEEWTVSSLTAEYRDPENAVTVLQDFVDRYPNHARARFALGQKLLAVDDAGGIEHLEAAMARDSSWVPSACRRAEEFLRGHGREDEAASFRQRSEEYGKTLTAAKKERNRIRGGDRLVSHDLAPERLEALRETLSRFGRVQKAFLVKKEVRHLSDKPCYYLMVVLKTGLFLEPGDDLWLVNQLKREIGGLYVVRALYSAAISVRRRVGRVPGSLIYQRNG